MSLYPSPTTGLGVAAKIVVEGNQDTKTTPGYNDVVLSASGGANGQTTFQLNPQIQDAAGNVIDPGTAFALTSVGNSTPGSLALTSVGASANGKATYVGTITGGNTNAFVGKLFTVAGFGNSVNNGAFVAAGSNNTNLILDNAVAVAETASATATAEQGTAVYTGTITGGNTNVYVGDTFVVTGFANSVNNGTFIATANNNTTLTLENNLAVYQNNSSHATLQEDVNALTYVAWGAKTNNNGTVFPVNGGATAIATVSASGLITAVAPGGVEVEVSYPTFDNTSGTTGAANNNPNYNLPLNKIYASVNVSVVE